ncbi:YozE family protein [Lentibacillus sp. CBA3610]|uniref:YozE family protein n=1 Tax=Lentibacillus sp. CBA3610 TaxID=2518176 RepID=UPI0015962595|nr:YozE family protein [Lentibacillus sp. CBA3610]
MRSFYHYALTYRGRETDDKSRLADWMFFDHDFPKQSADYHEISNYPRVEQPFTNALAVFE